MQTVFRGSHLLRPSLLQIDRCGMQLKRFTGSRGLGHHQMMIMMAEKLTW
jgi:hypothetical protein